MSPRAPQLHVNGYKQVCISPRKEVKLDRNITPIPNVTEILPEYLETKYVEGHIQASLIIRRAKHMHFMQSLQRKNKPDFYCQNVQCGSCVFFLKEYCGSRDVPLRISVAL
jgi:hypothetical protein